MRCRIFEPLIFADLPRRARLGVFLSKALRGAADEGALSSRPFFFEVPVIRSCASNCNTMATGDNIKLPLTSHDVQTERLAQLRELFPEAFTEGKLDLEKFLSLLWLHAPPGN